MNKPRCMFREEHFWKRIPFKDMNNLLSGCHPDYPQEFLRTHWVSDSCGFRVSKNVIKPKKCNPRLTNCIQFEPSSSFKAKYLAYEGIRCSGHGICDVRVKLCYLVNSEVDIYVISTNHGPDFKGLGGKVPQFIRTEINKNDDEMKKIGKIGTSAFTEYLQLCKKKEKKEINATMLPTMKSIRNTLYYSRKKFNLPGQSLEQLEHFIKSSPNVIYPLEKEDYPCQAAKEGKPVVLIMKFPDDVFNDFLIHSKKRDYNIWGMDSQYVNNCEQFPLTIICTQNTRHNTIPGFVALSTKSDEASYTKILSEVMINLRACDPDYFKLRTYVMIDKCISEMNAVQNNQLIPLLCQFHVVRTWCNRINKCFKDKDARIKCSTNLFNQKKLFTHYYSRS